MQIVFFCPPAHILNGGMRPLFRMAEVLRDLGHDAVVFEELGRRPAWFSSTAPVVGQGIFRQDENQILVLPEDQPAIMELFSTWPNPKIIYMQNHFYAAAALGKVESLADYGVRHILCSSRTIEAYAKERHPRAQAHFIPCGIDSGLFHPLPKQEKIAFIPRKRRIEATYIRDLFACRYPALRYWAWEPVVDCTEKETARIMGESAVFLSLARLDGFGLTAVEAMAAGCIVAGFTGGGGRDYADPSNGFWAAEDDFDACTAQLAAAVALAQKGPEDKDFQAVHTAAQSVAAAYTPASFTKATAQVWSQILAR